MQIMASIDAKNGMHPSQLWQLAMKITTRCAQKLQPHSGRPHSLLAFGVSRVIHFSRGQDID
jgi:hypothetical protein